MKCFYVVGVVEIAIYFDKEMKVQSTSSYAMSHSFFFYVLHLQLNYFWNHKLMLFNYAIIVFIEIFFNIIKISLRLLINDNREDSKLFNQILFLKFMFNECNYLILFSDFENPYEYS